MDKYDEAIEYFTKRPHEIGKAWTVPRFHTHGCLFNMACRNLAPDQISLLNIGCLTMIRNGNYKAETDKLTKEIFLDERIPLDSNIKLKDLLIFAEWQRKLDKELIPA